MRRSSPLVVILALAASACSSIHGVRLKANTTPVLLGPITRIGGKPGRCGNALPLNNETRVKITGVALPGSREQVTMAEPMLQPINDLLGDSTSNICLERMVAGSYLFNVGIVTQATSSVRLESVGAQP